MKELKLNIVPFKSIGPIIFGLHKDKIREIIKEYGPYETFQRDLSKKEETDIFMDSKIQIGYDENDLCQCVEIIDMDVEYKNKILNILSAKELINLSTKKFEIIDETYFLDELGVLINQGFVDGDDDIANGSDSILIASTKEYNELRKVYRN
ncbi:MAG: hypothetical protein ACRCXZ_03000 [Patescibacteria group bacterium]